MERKIYRTGEAVEQTFVIAVRKAVKSTGGRTLAVSDPDKKSETRLYVAKLYRL